MNISHPILLEIYDMQLMSIKKRLIKSYNVEYLNVILNEDIIKRYKLWIKNDKPTFMTHSVMKLYYMKDEQKIIQLIQP